MFASERSSSEGYTKIFAAQLATPSRVRLPVAKNTWQIFSKLLAWSVLVDETGDFLMTYLNREKHMFGKSWSVLKRCSVFPRTFYDYSLSLSTETNPNTSCHSLQTPFLHHLNSKSSRKRYGFSLSHSIFLVLSISLLILWVDILICDGLVIQCWVLSVYGLLRLLVYVNSFRLLDLFIIICFTICLGFVDWFIPISFELTLFSWFKMIEFCLLDYIDLIPC